MSGEIANEFWWSKLGFWVLIFGLAGEILVLRVPKTHETLEKILTFFFVVVIIAGVTLEHNADSAVAELTSKQETDAGVKIASLGKEAAESNARAQEFEREAAELKSKNLALEAEIAPRKVSDGDAKSLIDSLRPFAGSAISVKSYIGDVEGVRLLMILSQIFSRAGLKPTPGYVYFDTSSKMSILLGMELDSPPEQKDLADVLQKDFATMNLGIRPQWYSKEAGTPITLWIGVKPFDIRGIIP
jgi:hypothetical protein